MVSRLAVLLLTLAVSAVFGADLVTISTAIDRGEFASALRQAAAFVHLHPDSAPARVALARAHMGLNQGHAALDDLRLALRHDPDSLDALYYLSKLTAVLSQQQFAELAQIAPDSARMHQVQGELFEARGDGASAEREYLVALEKKPGNSSILDALGDLKRHDKQFSAALEWYQKALEKDPNDYDALYGAGVCHRAAQSRGEALTLFRRALKADPSSMAAKMAVGESLLLAGNAKEALPLLEQAANSDSRQRRLQFLIARAYQAVGRTEDARRAAVRARDLPEEPEQ